MAAENHNGMQCTEFDALLSDALDQTLTGPKLESFQAHARGCRGLRAVAGGSGAGQRWLQELVEVEPPVNLVHNILAATSGIDTVRLRRTARAPVRIRGLIGAGLGHEWSARSSGWPGSRASPCRLAWPFFHCRFR